MKDGDQFGDSVSVFTDWAIDGAHNFNNVKCKAYFYKRVLGAWDNRQKFRQVMRVMVIFLVEVFLLMKNRDCQSTL